MKIIEIIAPEENFQKFHKKKAELQLDDRAVLWNESLNNNMRVVRLLVEDKRSQTISDSLHGLLGLNGHLIIYEPEVVLPRQENGDKAKSLRKSASEQTREELYEKVSKATRLDANYVLLVCLSTIVAAIGLMADNIAVVVGAMVIAPLLGPNISMALATALGDTKLLADSLVSNLVGLGLVIALSYFISLLLPIPMESRELLSRTDVGLDGVALALASGAAAALSLTTGLSSVLVGVMVAVALLPPASTLGIMLGSGETDLALGASLLLAVNIVCVNLAAKMVFYVKGIKPRTWLQLTKARQSSLVSLMIWVLSLSFLIWIIITRNRELLTAM